MKNTLFFFVAFFAVCSVQAQQLQQLHVGDREPTFYYWDTNWWDYVYFTYPPHSTNLWSQHHLIISTSPICATGCKCELARPCHTDTALRIIGVAAPIYINWYTECQYPYLLPEYFNLYTVGDSNEMVLQASARWDNFTPRYEICTGVYSHYHWDIDSIWEEEIFYPLYEAYFDQPVTVNGDFYVSGTSNNNIDTGGWEKDTYQYGDSTYTYEYEVHWRLHPSVQYIGSSYQQNSENPNIGVPLHHFTMRRFRYIDEWNTPIYMFPQDTLWHRWDYPQNNDLFNMFPIFDTSSSVAGIDTDTCLTPTGLHMEALSDSTFLFTWNGDGATRWEFCLTPDGAIPDDSLSYTCNVAFTTVTLTDSARWYSARVRALCDSTLVSEWSDSIRLFVNNISGSGSGGGTTPAPSLLDTYTTLIPNPARDAVIVMSSFSVNTLEIYTLSGKLMTRQSPHAVSANVRLADYPSGTYIVRITTSQGVVYKKLIVQ